MGAASDGTRGHQSTTKDEVTRPFCRVYLARVRVLDKKNRALCRCIAELRGHTCQGPGLRFDYTLCWVLRKAPGRGPGLAVWACPAERLHIEPPTTRSKCRAGGPVPQPAAISDLGLKSRLRRCRSCWPGN
jgi:hypothetical protein